MSVGPQCLTFVNQPNPEDGMTRMKHITAALMTTAAIGASAMGAQAANIAVIAGSIEDGFFNLIKKGVDDATSWSRPTAARSTTCAFRTTTTSAPTS